MGGHERLKVDFETLIESETTLESLREDFDDMISRYREKSEIWGHHRMENAVKEATSNMDKNRDDLVSRLEAVREMVTNTLDNFEEADQELANELRKAMEEDG